MLTYLMNYLGKQQRKADKMYHAASKLIDDFQDPLAPLSNFDMLYKACEQGKLELVQLLLENTPDFDQNECNSEGKTPLWVASEKNHTEIVTLILEYEWEELA